MKKSAALLLALPALSVVPALAEEPTPYDADRVVVSASPLGQTLSESTQPVTILEGDKLALKLSGTIGDTLANEPGVSATSYGPGASRPVIRGLDGDRVRLMQNGLNSFDASSASPDHAVAFDPFLLDKIEVVRGPATLLYGSNAIGGVVNAIDSRINETPLGTPATGRLLLRAGSVDSETSATGQIQLGLGGWTFSLDASHRETGDLNIPGFARTDATAGSPSGTLPNSFTQTESLGAGLSYAWANGYFGASYSGFNTLYGSVAEQGVSINLRQRAFQTRGEWRDPAPGIKAIRARFGHSEYQHVELDGGVPGTTFENTASEGRVELLHAPAGIFEGAVGLQWQRNEFSALGTEAFLPTTLTSIGSAFIFEEVNLNPVTLQFGLRYDHQEIKANIFNSVFAGLLPARNNKFDTLSASLGACWSINDDWLLAASLAYTQRAPTATELHANGPHLATGAVEAGDPNLGLEKSLGLDLTLRKRLGWLTGSLSLFLNNFNGYISLNPTGEKFDFDGEELPIYRFQSVNARFYGVESEAVIHLLDSEKQTLHWEIGADYTHAENTSSGQPLPRIAPLRLRTALDYTAGQFNARMEINHYERQGRIAAFETETDSSTVLNASLTYHLPVGPLDLTAYLKGTNLTDEEVRLHTSVLKDIAPLAGRGVVIGLEWRF